VSDAKAGRVPPFATYYPVVEDMSAEQRTFFSFLVSEIESNHHPSVDGNVSYLFAYVYRLLRQWNRQGYAWVYDRLLDLAEVYDSEESFVSCCRRWSYDCLLGRRMYDRFLLLTEPEDVFATSTHFSNLRCNVFYVLGQPPTGVDLLKLSGAKVTPFTHEYPAAFRDFLEVSFAEDAQQHGPWLDRLLGAQAEAKTYGCTLFTGTPIAQPRVPFDYYCFYAAYEYLDVVRNVVRDAENRLRVACSVPRVGEGWLAETKLFYAVRDAFPETNVVQHGMPPWLGRQHLDIWIPRWNIAIEYQGGQHFNPVGIFGGVEGFQATVDRDARKHQLCKDNGVGLIIATSSSSHAAVIEHVTRVHTAGRCDDAGPSEL
jgi:hypothetical protein